MLSFVPMRPTVYEQGNKPPYTNFRANDHASCRVIWTLRANLKPLLRVVNSKYPTNYEYHDGDDDVSFPSQGRLLESRRNMSLLS